MDVPNLILSVWNRLIGSRGVDPAEPPLTREPASEADPYADVTVYRTSRLDKRNGKAPSTTVARYIASAFDEAGFGYRIDYGFQPIDNPYPPEKKGKLLDWWRKQERPRTASTSNLLIRDARGGGVAGLTGKFGVSAGRHIEHHMPVAQVGRTLAHRNIRGSIHEVGHNMGGKHSDNMLEPPLMTYTTTGVQAFRDYFGEQK